MSLLDIAVKEIGEKEKPIHNVKYNTWFYNHRVSGNAYPWCVVFILWCLNQMDKSDAYFAHTASVKKLLRNFMDKGIYHQKNDYTPKIGDIMFLVGHVCIVYSISEGEIQTIDGNYNGAVTIVKRSLDDSQITGYGDVSQYLQEVKVNGLN